MWLTAATLTSATVGTIGRLPALAAAPRFAMRRILAPVLAAAALLAVPLAVGTPAAAASTPCWKQLLNDYFPDGRIDKTYQLSCYNQAIAHLHEDTAVYGSAVDDIKRALASAILGYDATHKGPPGPSAFLSPENLGAKTRHTQGFLDRIAKAIGPGNASSIPLPLLILAGLGVLLVIAAGGSYAARRINARRAAQPRPATFPPGPPPGRK